MRNPTRIPRRIPRRTPGRIPRGNPMGIPRRIPRRIPTRTPGRFPRRNPRREDSYEDSSPTKGQQRNPCVFFALGFSCGGACVLLRMPAGWACNTPLEHAPQHAPQAPARAARALNAGGRAPTGRIAARRVKLAAACYTIARSHSLTCLLPSLRRS